MQWLEKFSKFRKSYGRKPKGQSFLELALVLPILILILLGLVEVSMYIGRYLDAIDLTREATRFASVRDPFAVAASSDEDCSTPESFEFYYDIGCIFSPPQTLECQNAKDPFCNGLNPYITLDPATDDVVISVFTVEGANVVSDTHPKSGSGSDSATDEGGKTTNYWALSNTSWGSGPGTNNWAKDCKGNVERDHPYYTLTHIQEIVNPAAYGSTRVAAPASKGFVAVEVYYCYDQVLSLPIFTIFVPDPLMIHAYTIMPLPAAAPTPTPKP